MRLTSLALGVAALATTLATTQANDLVTPDIRRAVVNKMNVLKCMHGQGPDTSDPSKTTTEFYSYACCNTYAQEWADKMAPSGTLDHSSNADRNLGTCGRFGENLSAGPANFLATFDGLYTKELKCWDFTKSEAATPSCTYGHMTSLIWKNSNLVSLGAAPGPTYGRFFVIQNGAIGNAPNTIGQFADNVTPPSTDPSRTEEACTAFVEKWAAIHQKDMDVICSSETDDSNPPPKDPGSGYAAADLTKVTITLSPKSDTTQEQIDAFVAKLGGIFAKCSKGQVAQVPVSGPNTLGVVTYSAVVPKKNECTDILKVTGDSAVGKIFDVNSSSLTTASVSDSCAQKESLCGTACGVQCSTGSRCESNDDCVNSDCSTKSWKCNSVALSTFVTMMVMFIALFGLMF